MRSKVSVTQFLATTQVHTLIITQFSRTVIAYDILYLKGLRSNHLLSRKLNRSLGPYYGNLAGWWMCTEVVIQVKPVFVDVTPWHFIGIKGILNLAS